METNNITHIEYEKTTGDRKGEITKRFVVPTYVPGNNMKAIDVTDLSEEEREEVVELHTEYVEYYKQAVANLFTFEGWLDHTRDNHPNLKWRTFCMENVKDLD